MEVISRHHRHHHSHLGEEKHLMLNLNRRLESYLGRVQQLEEENDLLRQEIHTRRQSNQGVSTHRKGLEKELRLARQEVEAVWQERDRAELEVGSLVEELEALAAQRQRVAEAQAEAKKKLDESRKEMEVEQRAQIWLREKVCQLEQDIELQIQGHEDEVAHVEATLIRSRPIMAPPSALMSNQMPSLLQLGQEYSQRAATAWHEATEAYQIQLGQLEDSLSQARHRLVQVDQEKSESQLKLQTLQKELASAQDVRQYLEKRVIHQRDRHSQELQQLQDHLESLEAEKEELSQQIDGLLVDSRGLLQLKMSLDLEVATYRALLDNESLRGDISSVSQMRHLYIPDALSSPQRVKRNDQGQMSTTHMSFPLSSIRGVNGRSKPTSITTASIWPATLNETLATSQKTTRNPTDAPTAETPRKLENMSTPYPKILPSGSVENFRPQEIHEEVSYAEPLSLPDEQEVVAESLVAPSHGEAIAAVATGYQVEFSLSSEPLFNKEPEHHQYNTGNLARFSAPLMQVSSGFSEEHIKDVPFEVSSGKTGVYERHTPTYAGVETFEKTEEIQDESSESETEALIEPAFDSSTTSPPSECEPEDGVFNQSTETDSISNEVAGMVSQQEDNSIVRTNFDDKLYPDGEEMDSWDSVIERKKYLKKVDESDTQHAEPDQDILTRELEHDEQVMKAEVASVIQNEPSHMTFTLMHTESHDYGQQEDTKQHHVDQAEEENDEEDDSQNVSVSWKTELESDSYAQDNTVADTRPLIRYKSDETDTTQASHVDETESSEGEEDRKVGEAGIAKWNESKSNRFGTMEDLCEDAEGEPLGEDYDLGYTTLSNYEKADMIAQVNKELSDEETEELTEPVETTVISNVDCDEELERVDKLVEQELEHLSTATYSMHFAEQQATENKSDNRSVCSDHNSRPESQVHTVEESNDESSNICQHSQPVSTTHVLSDEEDLLDAAVPNPIKETVSFEVSSDSLEHSVGKRADCLPFPEVPQTAEWEVLERPSQEIETRGQFADDYMYDDVHESTQSYFHNSDSIYQGTVTQNEESSEASPERIPVNTDIFPVKDSNKYLKTNEGLHDFISSGMKDDFWGSNLETGASYQPDDFSNHTAEQSNHNLGFSNTSAWGNLEKHREENPENPSVANGNGRMETDSPKPLGDKEEHRPAQAKQLCRDVAEGEKGHSMYSEDEGESWSSGEE